MMYTYARKHGTNNYFLESGNMKVLNLDAVIAETLNTEGKILGVSDRKIVAGQLGSNSINNRRRRASAGRLAMISLQPNALRQFCCILKISFFQYGIVCEVLLLYCVRLLPRTAGHLVPHPDG